MDLLLNFFPFALILLIVFGVRFVIRKPKNSQTRATPLEKTLIIISIITVAFGLTFAIGFN